MRPRRPPGRRAPPAGAHWIDAYQNADATEVMYGFHSDKGMGMIKRLPRNILNNFIS